MKTFSPSGVISGDAFVLTSGGTLSEGEAIGMRQRSDLHLLGVSLDDYSRRIAWALAWTLVLLAVLAIALASVFNIPFSA